MDGVGGESEADVSPRSLLISGLHSWVAGPAHLYLPAASLFRDDTLSLK